MKSSGKTDHSCAFQAMSVNPLSNVSAPSLLRCFANAGGCLIKNWIQGSLAISLKCPNCRPSMFKSSIFLPKPLFAVVLDHAGIVCVKGVATLTVLANIVSTTELLGTLKNPYL